MKCTILGAASAALSLSPALAAEAATHASVEADGPAIVVTAARAEDNMASAPNTRVTLDAETIRRRTTAISVEDTLKQVPGLILRKRHVGDNFAPIATRTSGLGSSARSLIYADGVLLSALIGNNNGSASPRWQMVAPAEVERIEVLYGPYSAAYPGNAIGTVVNITTRAPERLEATVDVLGNVQHHRQYATSRTLGTGQLSASLGGRAGPLSVFASATHTVSNGQPLAYVTAASAPAGTTGAIATVNRLGQPVFVLGASDIDHHRQDAAKLKLRLDLTPEVRAAYTLGLFMDHSQAGVDSYLRDGAGQPVYTSGFNPGYYLRESRHWAHALTLAGAGEGLDWKLTGSLYNQARDLQSSPSGLLPGGAAGGAGTVQDQSGTGWATLDAHATWRAGERDRTGLAANTLSLGLHADRYVLRSRSFASTAWQAHAQGTPGAASLGKTRTLALWAEDQVRLASGLSLTLGARQEWWRAWDGFNQTSAAVPGVVQAERRASGLSPKVSLGWQGSGGWSARLSAAQAWRFATVGELYGATTVGTVLANPNPALRPERGRSAELAVEHRDQRGSLRLSLFGEVVDDALVSQTGTVSAPQPGGTVLTATATFVQNVERTRARGMELAIDRRDVVPGFDLAASVTFSDAITSRNSALPAAEGKRLPGVPRWKANAALTWRPDDRLSLTGAARLSSRNYGTLDNSDRVADTYQGFDRFFVVDLRATWKASAHVEAALGVDNLFGHRYFLFHPFPQRSVTAELHWKL